MFYCSAQQLVSWLASIQMNLPQLAAAAERGRSITTRRIAAASVNDATKQNTPTCGCVPPREDKQIGDSGELGSKGANIAKLQQSNFAKTEKTNAPTASDN